MSRLRLGVVGVGHLGKEHARILSGMDDVELVGIADPNTTQGEAVAMRCGTRHFADHRALLPLVDGVVVATPTIHHHAVARDFLSQGIAVLIEKPITPTLAEADDLIALAAERDAILQVGHIERFNPAYEALRERAVQARYVSCERFSTFTGRSGDVGVVLDLMIHDIDLVLALVRSRVQRVEALGTAVLGGHEDAVQARIVFSNGCVADLAASRVHPTAVRRMNVWAPEGFIGLDLGKRKALLAQPASHVRAGRLDSRRLDPATAATIKTELFGRHILSREFDCQSATDQLTAELRNFTDCIRTRSTPRVDGLAGRDALDLATRILASVRDHAWNGIEGPPGMPVPQCQLFEDGDQAAAAAA